MICCLLQPPPLSPTHPPSSLYPPTIHQPIHLPSLPPPPSSSTGPSSPSSPFSMLRCWVSWRYWGWWELDQAVLSVEYLELLMRGSFTHGPGLNHPLHPFHLLFKLSTPQDLSFKMCFPSIFLCLQVMASSRISSRYFFSHVGLD